MLRRPALTLLAAQIVLGLPVVACVGTPPPSTSDPDTEPSIAARWAAEDGSVVALNVVLGRATDPRRIPEMARRYRLEHAGSRLIVRFFAATAGAERFVIGYVPSDGGPLPTDARPSTVLVTFDFPAPSSMPTGDGP